MRRARAAEGKLIGAIGDDQRAPIIEIGSNYEFTADRNGRLFLTVNRGAYADARGGFDVSAFAVSVIRMRGTMISIAAGYARGIVTTPAEAGWRETSASGLLTCRPTILAASTPASTCDR